MASCINENVCNSERPPYSDERAEPVESSESYENKNLQNSSSQDKNCFTLFAKAIMVRLPDT